MKLIRQQHVSESVIAVPEPTDYGTIAERYAEKSMNDPGMRFYERPATLALPPDVRDIDVLDAGCGHG